MGAYIPHKWKITLLDSLCSKVCTETYKLLLNMSSDNNKVIKQKFNLGELRTFIWSSFAEEKNNTENVQIIKQFSSQFVIYSCFNNILGGRKMNSKFKIIINYISELISIGKSSMIFNCHDGILMLFITWAMNI